MAFVLVQHLDPLHESALVQLLARVTSLPVQEVTNELRVAPDHVYVIPPNTDLGITRGVLRLRPRSQSRTPHRSIDHFLEALAEDQHELAIGVVLSGTATDGTVGLEAIKAEGGITFAQDSSARYDSMPRSAVAAGCVDYVLAPERIAAELAAIARHPHVVGRAPQSPAERASVAPRGADGSRKILLLLRNHSGVDFSLYKPSTIQRRIRRRMVLSKQDTLASYAKLLRGNVQELDALYSDILISVTTFFRNPEAFDVLKRKVFPKLFEQRGDQPHRVWVLGCSSGQEAYSIAMAFVEAAEKAPRMRKLQVFATDLNDALLDKARRGLYPKSIAQDVSPERLRKFFTEEEGGYRIGRALREMVVFARQNVIVDPPFSRMDLISCRNVLIYLEPGSQQKVFPVFHYALKPEGFLYLGASESIAGFTELFDPVDKRHKIYVKKAAATPAFQVPGRNVRADRVAAASRKTPATPPSGEWQAEPEGLPTERGAEREADRVTVHQLAPPSVLIDAELQILQFRGSTGAYLEPPSGKASFDVLKMARDGLMLPLRAAIDEAKKGGEAARRENVRVAHDGETRAVTVQVIPLRNLREPRFLIVFEDATGAGKAARGTGARKSPLRKKAAASATRGETARRVAELERERAETRDYLRSVLEQHEAANEELQASNEEVQSANEELQSVNEELETSKEELESANEELTTVNEEMANRNAELGRLNSDLLNVQTSTHLAIVLLGRDLTIRRFSAQAEKQFNLLAADVGRPFSSIRHRLDLPDLDPFVADVIETVEARTRELQDESGRWYSLRVRPYLTLDNVVDGAVLVLVDIDDLKRSERAVAAERDYAGAIIRHTRDPLLVLNADLRVHTANQAFYDKFGVTSLEAVGRSIYELGNGQWDIPRLRELLEAILPRNSVFDDFEVTLEVPAIGRRTMYLNARRLGAAGDEHARILLGIEDVTERKQREDALAEADRRKNEFLAMLAHELRNPLAPIRNSLEIIRQIAIEEPLRQTGPRPPASPIASAVDMMERQVGHLVRLVDDLLDVSRVSRGKIELRKERIELTAIVRHVGEAARPLCEHLGHQLTVTLPEEPVFLHADPVRLVQIVDNLLNNACKFTDEGGHIWLSVEAGSLPATAVIRVRDDGIGIAAEQLPHLFDLFMQVDSSLERSFAGLGIGLALAKDLVEMHGGAIEVRSAGIGHGSEFVVGLPILAEAVAPLPTTPSTPKVAAARRVLVVDDNRDSADSLAMLLRLSGHETHVAYDGLEAVDAAATLRPDVILLDIGLPTLSGYEAARRIRAQRSGDGLLLVALTGLGQEADRRRSKDAGFDAHLVKPVDYAVLVKMLVERNAG